MIAALLLGGTAFHRLHAAELQPVFRTAGIFTDHMVLQRDQPLPVWGWAAPGRTVNVEVGPHSARTRSHPLAPARTRKGAGALPSRPSKAAKVR
jgi:sialate O-acetylesterase